MKHQRSSPRGFTLLEVTLAVVLLSTILTIIGVTLGGLARADRRMRDRIDRDRNVEQFVNRLRQDVHEASDYTLSPAAGTVPEADVQPAVTTMPRILTLTRQDRGAVRFELNGNRMLRVVTRSDVDVHRETYEWDSPATAAWTVDTSQASPILTLHLEISGTAARPAEHYVVHATLLNSQLTPDE